MKNFEKQITANLKKGQKENEFRGTFETILKQIQKKKNVNIKAGRSICHSSKAASI